MFVEWVVVGPAGADIRSRGRDSPTSSETLPPLHPRTGGDGLTWATSITVRVPPAIRRRLGRKTMVTPVQKGLLAVATRAESTLVKALARAFRYQKLLDEGRYASISEMAEGERIERGFLRTLLRLMLLAPDIVEAAFDGRQPVGMTLRGLMEPLSLEWVG
jgi:hypothetical protein